MEPIRGAVSFRNVDEVLISSIKHRLKDATCVISIFISAFQLSTKAIPKSLHIVDIALTMRNMPYSLRAYAKDSLLHAKSSLGLVERIENPLKTHFITTILVT